MKTKYYQTIHDNDSTLKIEDLKPEPDCIFLRSVIPQNNNMKIVHFWKISVDDSDNSSYWYYKIESKFAENN